MQHEITESKPLLDADGNLTEPGFAKRLLPVYRRSDIRAPKASIKEWDYYLINNGRFALALTIDDNGYMLLLLGFVARSMTWTWIVYGALYVLFGIILTVQYRSKIFRKNK